MKIQGTSFYPTFTAEVLIGNVCKNLWITCICVSIQVLYTIFFRHKKDIYKNENESSHYSSVWKYFVLMSSIRIFFSNVMLTLDREVLLKSQSDLVIKFFIDSRTMYGPCQEYNQFRYWTIILGNLNLSKEVRVNPGLFYKYSLKNYVDKLNLCSCSRLM